MCIRDRAAASLEVPSIIAVAGSMMTGDWRGERLGASGLDVVPVADGEAPEVVHRGERLGAFGHVVFPFEVWDVGAENGDGVDGADNGDGDDEGTNTDNNKAEKKPDLTSIMDKASIAAALNCEKIGCNPPSKEDIEIFINKENFENNA